VSEPEDLFTENIIQKTAEALVSTYSDARVFSDRKGLISAVMEHWQSRRSKSLITGREGSHKKRSAQFVWAN